MNNNNSNRNNNNRRRGRGNNNRPQGGGQQLNRIDSRARGNAPQMLEKYRKLASDAHLNGDRVQAEYYLQFADHYFRVIADTRVRQEEQRGGRRDENSGEGGNYDQGDDGEFGNEGDMPGFDQPMNYRREEPREPREPRENRESREPRQDDGNRESRSYEQRGPQRPRQPEAQPVAEAAPEGEGDSQPPAANPFTRNTRGLRPRRDRDERPAADRSSEAAEPFGLDPSILPPAIAESRAAVIASEGDEAPAPRRRGRPRKTPIADGGEPLEVVGG
ncbi:MAG: DUF4167 domain-containing protein [Novosphingobium sp.]|nr:DUF4167 domain-containing protein [Novosphingobium sp.]